MVPRQRSLFGQKKRSNDQPSVADFCRLCKCSFKTVYGNFPPKSTSSELSKDPQPKVSYISTENIFTVKTGRQAFLSRVD